MNQAELDRQIVESTGDELETVRRLGFGPLGPLILEERDPLVVDWDALDKTAIGIARASNKHA